MHSISHNIALMAELIQLAYYPDQGDRHLDLYYEGDEIRPETWDLKHEEHNKTQVLLGVSSLGRRAVVFPGTNELADWRTNLRVRPVEHVGLPGKWHEGFMTSAVDILDHVVLPFLSRTQGPILIGGHSLGGALAGCLSALLAVRSHGEHVSDVTTWAAPRFTTGPGSAFLEVYYGGRATRIFAGFDIVPHLVPAGILFLRYRHAFPLLYLGTGGKLSTAYTLRTRLRELVLALSTRGLQVIGHHLFAHYLTWTRTERRARHGS